jgi:urocanate hydratase
MGIIRHTDAGYEEAIEFAEKNDVNLPVRKEARNSPPVQEGS